jgi:hypothetical protein
MPIKRRITTTTEEFDDSPTLVPKNNLDKQEANIETQTEFKPHYEDDDQYEKANSDNIHSTKITVGRTYADLLVEFKNDHRWMTLIIITAVFGFYTIKLNNINEFNFKIPTIIAVILLSIWYGFSGISWLRKNRNRMKRKSFRNNRKQSN